MHKLLLLTIFLGVTLVGVAQTRRIAHRTHGGTKTEHYDGRDGSYGAPLPYMVAAHKYDTVYVRTGKDSVMNIIDSMYYTVDSTWFQHLLGDTTGIHPQGSNVPVNDVRDLGKICSRRTLR